MDWEEDSVSCAMPALPSPVVVAPLAAAQFPAAGWVVLNQFRDHLGLEAGAKYGLVAKGYLGAALFFVLGGFLVCRHYDQLRRSGRFRYGAFLWQRISFTYPLHLAVLAITIGMLALGAILGEPAHHASFKLWDLPANLLLVQGWGAVATDTWNFPSWLISAEWFAYLIFPATAWIALRGLRWNALAVSALIALFAMMFLLAGRMGILFTDMTTRIGALQTVPAFLLGAALWRLNHAHTLPPVVGAAVAASLRLSDLVIWPAFAPLVFGLAQLHAAAGSPWNAPMAHLGRICTAMVLVYLPVDILYFRAVHLLLGTPHGLRAWLVLLGVFPAILLAAAVAYHGLQRPAWLWLRARGPFGGRAARASGAIDYFG